MVWLVEYTRLTTFRYISWCEEGTENRKEEINCY